MASLSLQSKIALNSGHEIPQLGFGLWQISDTEAETHCKSALDAGYRHLDSAAAYHNERGCGEAIRAISSKIPRSDIFLTSKIPPRSLGYSETQHQVEQTLKETGLDYIDLMLIHAPYGGSARRKEAWKALVEAVEAGKVRSIGVSNYGVNHLDELEQHIKELESECGAGKGGVLSVGQWEIHPWCPRNDIVEWCKKRNVAIEAYSPLVRGKRWGEPELKRLAEKYGKTEAQVLIRWSLQKGYLPLPKSANFDRIKANAEVYDFELTPEEITSLESKEYSPVCWDPTVSEMEE